MQTAAVQEISRQGVYRRFLRHSNWDAVLIALSVSQPAALWLSPSLPVVAIAIWWNSNTVSHNFIHLPFFQSRAWNRAYSFYLTLILGFPQTLWRDRHLAHHAERPYVFRWSNVTSPMLAELGLLLALWVTMLWIVPTFFWTTYLPGYALGLCLCYIHGYFEHAHGTTSHYGWLGNVLFFNDGYHVEHHVRPGAHWTRLPDYVQAGTNRSQWPAVLRWLELCVKPR